MSDDDGDDGDGVDDEDLYSTASRFPNPIVIQLTPPSGPVFLRSDK